MFKKKLLPKTKGRICFSILTVRNYLKLEIEIRSFLEEVFFVNFAYEIY